MRRDVKRDHGLLCRRSVATVQAVLLCCAHLSAVGPHRGDVPEVSVWIHNQLAAFLQMHTAGGVSTRLNPSQLQYGFFELDSIKAPVKTTVGV